MGVDVSLKVKNLTLLYWKSFFDEKTLRIFFDPSDLQIKDNVKYDEEDNNNYPHKEYKYVTSVGKVVDRLNSIGYTLKKVEKIFNDKKCDILDYFTFNKDYEKLKQKIDRNVTFKKWANSVKKYSSFLLENNEDIYWFWELDKHNLPQTLIAKTFCDKIVYNSLQYYDSESFFGCLYEEFDPINTIRIILEFCNKTDNIEVDITEMVGFTYNSIEDMKISENIEKIIVLVEGTSDKDILEFGLKHIYPHLYNLYYFMSFEYTNGKKREGGADAISKNVKTFIASKIKSRFVAIFDNDTIGFQARNNLQEEIKIVPENFRITNYPDLKSFKKYPTIAPNKKIVLDNINKRAASIELYLPKFCLCDKSGNLYPVYWKSLIERKIGQAEYCDYQGEIKYKDKIKEKFFSFKADIENGKKTFNVDEWLNIKEILDHIIKIFY